MIDLTMAFLTERLDAHLQVAAPDGGGSLAMLSPLLSAGSSPIAANNKLAVTLVNVEQDPALRNTELMTRDASLRAVAPPLHLNLDVLISANFAADRYQSGLKVLSAAIGFFHSYPQFDTQSAPDLPPGLESLRIDWMDLDGVGRNEVWGALGARYRPSALYRVRGVVIADGAVTEVTPVITETGR